MLYSVEELTKAVKVAIDENVSGEPLLTLEDADALTLEEIVASKLVDAARIVETAAPRHLLGDGDTFVTEVEWYGSVGQGAGRVRLPDDFMRLLTFKMSDWSRAVVEPIGEDSEDYEKQQSKWGGVRGNPSRPVVALIHLGSVRALEFFSCTGGEGVTVSRARCLRYPKIEDGRINLCEGLKPAIVMKAASMVAASLGAAEQSKMLEDNTKELMQ